MLRAFPTGRLSEIVGPRSSGGSSLLLALLARATAAGGHVALVDGADALDVDSAQASGVELPRLLWVRCGGRLDAALRAADLLARCPGFAVVALDLGEDPLTRDQVVSPSIGLRLQRAVEGTPAALVLRTPHRLAGSAAALVVSLDRRAARWIGPPARNEHARPSRLAGLASEARVVRSRAPDARGAWTLEWRL